MPVRALTSAGGFARGWVAALAYCCATIFMTWPLSAVVGRDVASDLGDSLYYMWAIAWDCRQIAAIVGGEPSRIGAFFDANIFHPHPLTLAFSDHMIGQAVQALPLYALSANGILRYNLLFLSTFVLCGLGTYLFVRELTGNARAAFVAGLLFAFAPYRLGHSAHLNLLSVQWTPIALYALRRYFDTGRRAPLAGAAAALVAQNISSLYYLLYFFPFVAAYALWEIAARRARKSRRLWLDLTTAAIAVAAVTTPFVLPYLSLRDRLSGLRDVTDVSRYSADVFGYLTAPPDLRFWGGTLRMFPKPEGELFPGFIPVALAIAGIVAWARRSVVNAPAAGRPAVERRSRRDWLPRALLTLGLAYVAVAIAVVYFRRIAIDIGPVTAGANDVTRLLAIAAVALALTLTLSRGARSAAGRMMGEPEAWALIVLGAAWWLSLGPTPTTLGRPLEIAAPYAFLFEHVPGFAGARVPARYAMIVAFALAVLAGCGLHAIDRRRGTAAVAAAALLFLAETSVLPFPVNRVKPVPRLAAPEARVYPPDDAPRVYGAVRELRNAVLIEFPFGVAEYDRRAMYYSTMHWLPVVNGYSGFYPPDYARLTEFLSDLPGRPELARETLQQSGATHALVHEAAYLGDEGPRVSAWFRDTGAAEVFRDGGDVLFALPARSSEPGRSAPR